MDPDAIKTYAQFREDITLAALLHDVKEGFYVDVGANHEEYHSVTKYFYERGWSGINIEPIPHLIKEFEEKRQRDINVCAAVSDRKEKLVFREYPDHDGFSTFSDKMKKENAARGIKKFKDYDVPVFTLDELYREHNVTAVDFIKVDVEGFEESVIKSSDWAKVRPTVICIESNHRGADWSSLLSDHKYHKFINDGLNEYYIAEESTSITEGFAERAAILIHNALNLHHAQQWETTLAGMEKAKKHYHKTEDHLKEQIAANLNEIERLRLELEQFSSVKFQFRRLIDNLKRRLFGK